jgi:hypothetical protein
MILKVTEIKLYSASLIFPEKLSRDGWFNKLNSFREEGEA